MKSSLIGRATFILNGKQVTVEAPLSKNLARVLREDLGITSVKIGCEEGECGACTVLLDGIPVVSCMVILSQVIGRSVTTLEGLEQDPLMNRIKEKFIQLPAFQCGFCTPGFMITIWALMKELQTKKHLLRVGLQNVIADRLSGNLCRCGSYFRILHVINELIKELDIK